MYKPQDHYFHRAKQEQYLARSVYKLQEIDNKHKLIKPGQHILDLGCAPGSWLQYCARKAGKNALLVGVDHTPLPQAIAPNVHFIQADATELEPVQIISICPSFDLVLSDMAPATSGIKSVDQERSLQLAYSSWKLARQVLKPGGAYLVKVFQGEGVKGFLDNLKPHFAQVKTIKPKTSERSRLEIYVLAKNRRKE